jgi:hypothetical protein
MVSLSKTGVNSGIVSMYGEKAEVIVLVRCAARKGLKGSLRCADSSSLLSLQGTALLPIIALAT